MSTLHVFFLNVCLVAVGFAASADGWKTFRSEKHPFSVRYAPSWYMLNHTIDVLDIVNFPPSKRARGAFLPKGGAAIVVVPSTVVPTGQGITSLADWITKDLSRFTFLSKREVGSLSGESGACTQLIEVENEEEVDPNRYIDGTSYYCATHTGFYRVELSHWRGDPKQKQLQEVALKMALSLRSW